MSADETRSVLDDAWGRIPQTRETTAGLGSFTRRRIERAIALAAGFGFFILGIQAFLASIGSTEEGPGWHVVLVAGTFGPLAAMLLACLVGRGIRVFSAIFGVAYLVALLLWPLATRDGTPPVAAVEPWIWYLVNVATVAGVLAFPVVIQIGWTILLPLVFGAVRLIQAGFAADFWVPVLLDVSFALILGGVLLTLAWVFRAVAANVDETRLRAVESYASAAAADAAEQERVAVAALMHDSVLAALIAAERAQTGRERTLATAMAREALTRLANTEQSPEEGSDESTDAALIADEIERIARELGVRVTVQRMIVGDHPAVPGRVARALTLAALQAITNAVEHADAEGLTVSVRVVPEPVRVRIDVRDTGGGFALEDVPDDRLGIRASIIARVAAVGGAARIASGEHGTTVQLEWRAAT